LDTPIVSNFAMLKSCPKGTLGCSYTMAWSLWEA